MLLLLDEGPQKPDGPVDETGESDRLLLERDLPPLLRDG